MDSTEPVITEQEAQQLLLYLSDRQKWWTKMSPLSWALFKEGQFCFAFSLVALGETKITFSYLREGEDGWSVEDSRAYLTQILTFWTEYGIRKQVEGILSSRGVSEAGEVAQEVVNLRPNAEWPVSPQSSPKRDGKVGHFQFVGGGYLVLELISGVLRAQVSLPRSGEMSFGPVLQGYMRPFDGRILDVAAAIAGWEDKAVWRTRGDEAVCPTCKILDWVPAQWRRPPYSGCVSSNGCRCYVTGEEETR